MLLTSFELFAAITIWPPRLFNFGHLHYFIIIIIVLIFAGTWGVWLVGGRWMATDDIRHWRYWGTQKCVCLRPAKVFHSSANGQNRVFNSHWANIEYLSLFHLTWTNSFVHGNHHHVLWGWSTWQRFTVSSLNIREDGAHYEINEMKKTVKTRDNCNWITFSRFYRILCILNSTSPFIL